MRHIIDAIAAQGRDGDTELLHVTKGEMAGLDALARRHFGRSLPRNPRTGLKEASLFRDWFGNDVGMALDVAAPVAVGMIPGVGIPAAVAMGAATGAANQGLGKGGTTESALMGGVMGGIGAYGGSGLAEGLGAGATSTAPAGVATPTSTAGANLGSGTISDAGSQLAMGNTTTAGAYGPAAGSDMTGAGGMNLFQNTPNAATPSVMPNAAANTVQPGTTPVQMGIAGPENPAINVSNAPLTNQATTTVDKPLNWDYLKTKDALGPVTQIGTSALGTSQIPSGETSDTTSTVPGVNKTLPKAEVYYTPYGERRTRIVGAAQGGLMGFADYDAADAGADGGYAPGGIASYGFGGEVRNLQPGGAFGDWHGQTYGAIANATGIDPGGAMGSLIPGANQYHDKKQAEEEAKANEAKAKAAAAEKAQQEQQFRDQWQQRYQSNFAEGGTPMTPSWVPDSSKTIMGKDGIKIPADATAQDRAYLKALMEAKNPGVYVPRRRIGMNEGGIASMAQGRYLQGAGDGMSDSIKANIDGKQEARLATGEFVVPADVVSHLGNGDSTAGAKQLHSMMDRARMTRTGTKKQGKQINPRKVMPV